MLLGNVLVIPIQQSLLYVRPLYVQSTQNPVPQLRKVIVVYADQAAMGDTLQEALTQLFGAAQIFFFYLRRAHNPKVVGSNPTPATI